MRFKEFKVESIESLYEINMSPGKLQTTAAAVPGALIGIEFEMLVPDVADPDEDHLERDYSRAWHPRDISDIVRFFEESGELSQRQLTRLENDLQETYQEWKMDYVENLWAERGWDYFIQYYDENYFDSSSALEVAADYLKDNYPEYEPGSKKYDAAFNDIVRATLEKEANELWESEGVAYSRAKEDFESENIDGTSEQDWIRDRNLNMITIADDFGIDWPYYYNNTDGLVTIESIAEQFEDVINRPVRWSNRYKGCVRGPDNYCVEPDSSLEPDMGGMGLEFVSPPLPIKEMLSDIKIIKQWADKNGMYTNESTGLHMNVSIPDFSIDRLDYVKLALLLGDNKILEMFSRAGNTYTKSALKIIQKRLKDDPTLAEKAMSLLQRNLNLLASKSIHSGNTDKYTSINTKEGWIEFRSPGGDWLNENYELIIPSIMRFVVALDAALDPEKYKEEYAKKLYKLLASTTADPSIIEIFSNYSAGKVSKDQLVTLLKNRNQVRSVKKGQAGLYTWSVKVPTNSGMSEVLTIGKTEEQAKQNAAERLGLTPNPAEIKKWSATPIKQLMANPQTDANTTPQPEVTTPNNSRSLMPAGPGPWEIYRRNNGRDIETLRSRNRQQAHSEAMAYMTDLGITDEFLPHYGVRTIQSVEPDLSDIEQELAQNNR